MAGGFYFVRCSVIGYRHGTLVLYPLGEDKEKMRHLYGKRVYAIVVAEE